MSDLVQASGVQPPVAPSGGEANHALERLREWLAAGEADAVCVTDPVSVAYLTGFHADPHERLMALAVTPTTTVLIVPALERQSAEHRVRGISVLPWSDGEDPFAVLRGTLGDARRLAVEKNHMTVARAERLQGLQLVDAGDGIRQLRLRKSASELELLARAAEITDSVYELVISAVRPGMTELEIAALISEHVVAAGASLSFESSVQSGVHSALPHLRPTSRRVAHGDLLLLDFGARWEHYYADITRVGFLGEPGPDHLRVWQLVKDAHDAAIAAIREGVTTGAVDAAARRVIEAGGHGPEFIHRTGHGLGLEIHEGPNLTPGSDERLEAGMVVTVEPGIYIPGWGGVRLEDDIVVERDGARLLTHSDISLRPIASQFI